MSKQTRKERKKQEAEMLAEFDKELEKGRETDGQMRTVGQNASTDKVHCKRCKTLMEKGVCPICGYKIYMPMDDEKRKKNSACRYGGVFGRVRPFVCVDTKIRGTGTR